MTGAIHADSAAGYRGGGSGPWARHWAVLRDAWTLERERRAHRPHWRQTDFLPAALEVMETPPNPLGRLILWTLILFVVLALAWSILARLDVVAVAPAKVIAVGRNKLVQAADAGVVRAIHVRDGQRVAKGQPLLTLDPTESSANQAQARAQLETAEIDAARGRALLAALEGRPWRLRPPPGAPPELVATQRAMIDQRLAELAAKLATLDEQAAEARAQEAGAEAEVQRLTDTLPFLAERIDRRQRLVDSGYGSKLQQLELEQQRSDHLGQIAVQRQNARRAAATLAGIAEQRAQARAQGLREVLGDLNKAEADARMAREELTKANQKSAVQVVRAPADGVVQQLAVYSEGAVLKAADPILVVVPAHAALILEAQVLNKDIGFVRAGQSVTVKLEAFPFTRHGTLDGRVLWVSPDAIADEKLGPVYQARIAVSPPSPRVAATGVVVSPGLAATAEIRTARRRVIDYLLSPLERRLDEAGRER